VPLNVLLDLDHLHLVAHGERHRAALVRVPRPGEAVTMLCGYTDLVEYADRSSGFVGIRTCGPCDLAYRRRLGLHQPPNQSPSGRR
jgi:hypothetical protein